MQKITPCLWFDTEGEEAAEFYVSLFGDAKILKVTHYGEAGPRPAGTVMTVSFVLEGQEYMALNGGPEFPFTEAVSFSVSCEDQEEVDRLWARLLEGGGSEVACGWIKDRFGLQAAIAAEHAVAPSYAETRWGRVVALYDALLREWPSPVVELNRAVALAEVAGPEAALAEVDRLTADGRLAGYRYLPAARADLLRRLGRSAEAATAYDEALTLTDNAAERSFLTGRRDEARRS